MKAFLLTICFFLLFVVVFAQNAKIDSLKKVIETTKSDTVKGRSLCRLCSELRKLGQYEIGIKKSTEGLSLSEKTGDQHGIAYCLITLGEIHLDQSEYGKGIVCYRKSLEINQKIGDQVNISNCFNDIGNIYMNQGNYSQALEYLEKGLKIRQQIKDLSGIAKSYINIARLYRFRGDYPKALDYYNKSLNIYKKLNIKTGIAVCYNNLGIIYFTQNDFDHALQSYRSSLKIKEELNDKAGIAASFLNIGNVYYSQYQVSEALHYFQKALAIQEELGAKREIAGCLNNIGYVYKDQGKYESAIEYYKKSIDIYVMIGELDNKSRTYSNMSQCYLLARQPTLAKQAAENAMALARQCDNLEVLELAAITSFEADSALGDYKSAFEHHKLYKQYSDSLHNEDKAKEFGRIESRYQFEKEAEDQKRKQAEAKRIADLETQRRNNLQYLSIFAGLMVLFGGLAFVGKLKIPARVLDISLFAALLILFEFLLILFDPILDQFTGGIPIQKLVFNSVIALGFAPLHGFLEKKLKRRFAGR
jgi:tetratricopeptide (TPR) repeat protein